ncbi:PREDICTED: uncharacterized protein LOC109187574 [Ipomoea nil]|uniref:uncharacterized protein LOC109187574 n=1 Tax=Ipomoea nil TaxID=35883 RepID=UPI00090158EB|nr:PREDICTED: uncharacterized protein LOC109187574 [Ipomoea nil]XP_019193347.1 PREDICTED: uncharacterized protein LOC109187574 [Ipomoea nil]
MDVVDDGRVEPGELLEETWFFGNSLHGKSRMFTRHSHSDPPLVADEKSMEETYSSIKKIPELGTRSWSLLTRTGGPGLMKTASMPTNVKESSTRMYSTMNLQQMQYCGDLSTFAEKEELEDDEESEFCMGKLIRQASLNHARVQPPLPSVKGLRRSCSICSLPKQRISKITVGCESVYDNKTEERDEENVVRRRNCSELAAKSSPTPFQNIAKKSSSSSGQDDMKAQIKFWARAVASNVRQEC